MTDWRQLALAHLHVLGLPPTLREAALWTEPGLRRFLKRWPRAPTTSLRELELLLGLFDSQVRLTVTCKPARTSPLDASGSATPVVLRRLRDLHLTVHWQRPELAAHGELLTEAVRRTCRWWRPQDVAEILTWNVWPHGALAVAARKNPLPPGEAMPPQGSDRLLVGLCRLYGVRRRKAQPARTLLTAYVEREVALPRMRLVVADRDLSGFVANCATERLAWKCVVAGEPPGEDDEPSSRRSWTFLPLADGLTSLDFAADPRWDGAGRWLIDDQPVERRPIASWPELVSLPLPLPTRAGRPITLTYEAISNCGRAGGGLSVEVFPNPVRCGAVCRTSQGWVWSRAPLAAAPGSLVHPVAGHQGVTAMEQPFPLHAFRPAESDASVIARGRRQLLKQLRRADDVAASLAAEFSLAAGDFTCRAGAWLDIQTAPARWCEGYEVTLFPGAASDDEAARLATQIRRYLQRHVVAGHEVRVHWTVPSAEKG